MICCCCCRMGGLPAIPRPRLENAAIDDVPGFGVVAGDKELVDPVAAEVDGSDLIATVGTADEEASVVADTGTVGVLRTTVFLAAAEFISSKIFSSLMASAMMSFLRS